MRTKGVLLCFTIVGLYAAPACGDLVTQYRVVAPGFGRCGNGGPFLAVHEDGPALPQGSQFFTFCVEYSSQFFLGDAYHVEVADSAKGGGAGGKETDRAGGLHDPLDVKTAALYRQWLADPKLHNPADGALYQLAIWYNEDEAEWDHDRWEVPGTSVPLGAGTYAAYSLADVSDLLQDVDVSSGFGGVKVMRLWQYSPYSGGYVARQDQLTIIPAPAATMLGLLGLGGVAWIKRRMA